MQVDIRCYKIVSQTQESIQRKLREQSVHEMYLSIRISFRKRFYSNSSVSFFEIVPKKIFNRYAAGICSHRKNSPPMDSNISRILKIFAQLLLNKNVEFGNRSRYSRMLNKITKNFALNQREKSKTNLRSTTNYSYSRGNEYFKEMKVENLRFFQPLV